MFDGQGVMVNACWTSLLSKALSFSALWYSKARECDAGHASCPGIWNLLAGWRVMLAMISM